MPVWLVEWNSLSAENRLQIAGGRARELKLVQDRADGDHLVMELTPTGQKWLSSPLEGQYAHVFKYLREPPQQEAYFTNFAGDSRFLGCNVSAKPGRVRYG